MATRSLIALEELIEVRDGLVASYAEIAKTPINQYSMQDRQVIYEQRRFLRREIESWDRKIALADPDVNALGSNKVDFRNFRYNDSM